MKAEELRIGNLIYWDIPEKNGVVHEVRGIVNDRPQTIPISMGGSIDDYKPIPLTEEWLLKFGFEAKYKDTLFLISIQELHLKKLVLHRSHLDMNLWAIAFADYYTGEEKSEVFPTTLSYVHQLQNLYYALTGEELTIKES